MLTGPALSRFRKNLLAWFAQFQRELPWRQTRDPYRIWLSEIMLQQTRVAAAIPYYERFLEQFPNVETLATSIYQYASRGSFEEGALAALLIVAASIGPVAWLTRFSEIPSGPA